MDNETTDTQPHTLFVYGTLTSGLGAHRVLMKNAAKIGNATVSVGRLYHLPFGYPCIVTHAEKTAVKGEVYAVDDDTLAQVTGYERADGFDPVYRRLAGTATLDDGRSVDCLYFAIDSAHRRFMVSLMGTRIRNGDWRGFMRTYKPSLLVRAARAAMAVVVGSTLA